MVLKGERYKNWEQVMILFLAAYYMLNKIGKKKMFFNATRVSQYLATKQIDIDDTNVSRCLVRMTSEKWGNCYAKCETKAECKSSKRKKVDSYKKDNIYSEINIQAINEDLKQYQYGSGKDWLAHPDELKALWYDYVKFGHNYSKEDMYGDLVEKYLESKVNKYILGVLEEVNSNLPEDLKIKYLLEGERRETNALNSTINPDNHKKGTKKSADTGRYELLKPYIGEDFEYYDVNASIFRLHKDLVNDSIAPFYKTDEQGNILYKEEDGKLFPIADDIYERIFNRTVLKNKVAFKESIVQEWFDITGIYDEKMTFRKIVKNLTMPTYMREGTYANAAHQYNNVWDQAVWCNAQHQLPKEDLKTYYKYKLLEEKCGYNIWAIRYMWLVAMHEELAHKEMGTTTFLREQIFIYETNLHILMLKKFQDLGIKTANCYDGFYFPKGTVKPEDFYKVYCECLTELKELMNKFSEPVEAKLKPRKLKDVDYEKFLIDKTWEAEVLKQLDEAPVNLELAAYYEEKYAEQNYYEDTPFS